MDFFKLWNQCKDRNKFIKKFGVNNTFYQKKACLQLQQFHKRKEVDENGAKKKLRFIHVPMMVVWKPTPSQVISRLIIGLIRVKSLIFVAGKAAVGNLPDLTNSPGITENIQETGLFNVACANELFPGRIIWHYIWKDTSFPDEVIFLLFQISFLSDSYQVKF